MYYLSFNLLSIISKNFKNYFFLKFTLSKKVKVPFPITQDFHKRIFDTSFLCINVCCFFCQTFDMKLKQKWVENVLENIHLLWHFPNLFLNLTRTSRHQLTIFTFWMTFFSLLETHFSHFSLSQTSSLPIWLLRMLSLGFLPFLSNFKQPSFNAGICLSFFAHSVHFFRWNVSLGVNSLTFYKFLLRT